MKHNRPLPLGAKRYSETAQKVFTGKRFEIYQWQQRQFDSSLKTYEIVKRNDTVVIIPVINDKIVIVREQQPHWDKSGLTLVAGMVNPEEDLESAARRELEEETGMIFGAFHLMYIESAIPAVEWHTYTFIAANFRHRTEKKLDAGEQNEIVEIALEDLIRLTRERKLLYPPRFIEDYLIRGKETELRKALANPDIYELKT